MIYKEFGRNDLPTIILLHGGGLSWWSWQPLIDRLEERYHIIVPILPGHGHNTSQDFITIEACAKELITFIKEHYKGQVHTIAGLSIGAQILCEMLSIEPNICENAKIESALLIPIKGTKFMTLPMVKLSYGLISKRWFAKLQAKALYVPSAMFETYYLESQNMTKTSLVNLSLSNGSYCMKDAIKECSANIHIIVGEKEPKIMLRSAQVLHDALPYAKFYMARKMHHGEISLMNPDLWIYVTDL